VYSHLARWWPVAPGYLRHEAAGAGGPALRQWVNDPAATPGDLDALARHDESEWQSKE
jgi:hypothetical protein